MTDKSLTWCELADLVPALETIRREAAGTHINAHHPRWCRERAWSQFHGQIVALVGPACGSERRELLRWSSLDVARLVVFHTLPACAPGCDHTVGTRVRAEARELAEART